MSRTAILRLSLFAVAIGVALGCAGDRSTAPKGTMSDSLFIEVMVDLMGSQNVAGVDTAVTAIQRREVLGKYKVSAADLELKAEALARDIEHATTVWRTIRVRIGRDGRPADYDAIKAPRDTGK